MIFIYYGMILSNHSTLTYAICIELSNLVLLSVESEVIIVLTYPRPNLDCETICFRIFPTNPSWMLVLQFQRYIRLTLDAISDRYPR